MDDRTNYNDDYIEHEIPEFEQVRISRDQNYQELMT